MVVCAVLYWIVCAAVRNEVRVPVYSSLTSSPLVVSFPLLHEG